MDKYLDRSIYEKAKKEVYSDYKKPSAYRSMALVKKYQSLGGRLRNAGALVKPSKTKGTTQTWLKEKWKNLTPYATNEIKKINDLPVCGTRTKKQIKEKLPSICRPTKKVNSKTVKLAQDYTKKQIKKALKIKVNRKRIDWSEL
jgi:hypothetical protein